MRAVLAWVLIAFCIIFAAGAAQAAEPEEPPGLLGVNIRDLTKDEADKLGFEAPNGAYVVKPVEGGPAEAAGVQAGDLIQTVDDVEIEDARKFREVVGSKGAGSDVEFRLWRQGHSHTLTATLGARPMEVEAQSPLRLTLDTGGHSALIRGLTFTPDGKFIISAGDDKMIRVWDWRAGKTVRIIRGEAGVGNTGKIRALALSPNGTTVAVGGWFPGIREDEFSIRLHDIASGALTGRLKGHTDGVNSLAFSPDGSRLISGSADRTAILWDVESRVKLRQLEGHTAVVTAVGFTPDGARSVTGGNDTKLRLWRVSDGTLIKEMTGHEGKVLSLAVGPHHDAGQGQRTLIASSDDQGKIRLWDGATGMQLRVLRDKQRGSVGALVFTPDGRRLLATTGRDQGDGLTQLLDITTGQKLVSYKGHDHNVIAAAISSDGRFAAAGGDSDRTIRIWELATGKPVLSPGNKPLVLGGASSTIFAVGFSADGTNIAWGNTFNYRAHNDRGPIEFQLRLPQAGGETLGQPEPAAASHAPWRRAEAARGAIELSHHQGGKFGYADAVLDISRDGTVITSIERGPTTGSEHLAYTLIPDGQSLISGGTIGRLIAFDLTGKRRGAFISHVGSVFAVATSPDGHLLVSGSSDQTVRLWNLKTRELLMTLFRGNDGDWVAWTPQGYYTGSPGADRLVGWQLDKGPDQTPDYFSAEQLRRQFNRPDIVSKAILLGSATEAVRTSEGTRFTLNDLIKRPPPRVSIASPAAEPALTGGDTVAFVHIDPTPDPVRRLTVRVNGRTVHEQAVGNASGDIAVRVPLAKGRNVITVIASNEVGDTTAEVHVTHAGEGQLDKRGVLHVVAIGVDKYPNLNVCGPDRTASCDLQYSGADAETFADTIKHSLGSGHAKVEVQLLTASSGTLPTANNIRDALQRVRNLATETDTIVVFTAGHGVNDGADYLFLTSDATMEGRGWRGSTVLKWAELESVVFGARGARFLFVDTCHSSGAYNAKLGNEAFHNDVTAFTATGPEELALEFGELKHGVFTYTIAEGLGDHAREAASGTKEVRASALAKYLAARSSALIDKYQPGYEEREKRPKPVPHLYRARDAEDHVLARVE